MKNNDLRVGRRQLRRMVEQGIRDLADRVVEIQSTCQHSKVYECPPRLGAVIQDEFAQPVRICCECGLSETVSVDGSCVVLYDQEGRTVHETSRRRLHALKMGVHINLATSDWLASEKGTLSEVFDTWRNRDWFLLDNLTPCR